jgi:hypothetical protein
VLGQVLHIQMLVNMMVNEQQWSAWSQGLHTVSQSDCTRTATILMTPSGHQGPGL